jgi:hypothetical protein
MDSDYSRYQDPVYASDFSKVFRLQLYFMDSRKSPRGIDRNTARLLKKGCLESWRAFIASLRSEKCRDEVTRQVEKCFSFKIALVEASQAA